MGKIGFWAAFAAVVLAATGCVRDFREPVTLSDPRFDGVFQVDDGEKFDRFEFDGTSKVYKIDRYNYAEVQSGWVEFEVDAGKTKFHFRPWDDDAKWKNEWTRWQTYLFSNDGKTFWVDLPPGSSGPGFNEIWLNGYKKR